MSRGLSGSGYLDKVPSGHVSLAPKPFPLMGKDMSGESPKEGPLKSRAQGEVLVARGSGGPVWP